MDTKNRTKFFIFVGFFIFLIGFIACNRPTQPSAPPESTSGEMGMQNVYPHTPEFKSNHGGFFRQAAETCIKCHGKDLSGGNTKVSCQKCHGESFPHTGGWALPTSHGAFFVKQSEENRNRCDTCHRVNPSKPNIVSCQTCHTPLPHDDAFKGGGHAAEARTFEGKCTACHTDFKRNLPNFQECSMCHEDKSKFKISFPLKGEGHSEQKSTLTKPARKSK